MSKLTLVTCLFDLGRREATSWRGIDDYFRFGEFVLGLDQDIVFFVDLEMESRILEGRQRHGRLARTRVIPIGLEDLSCAKYLEPIRKGRRASNANPVKDTPSYTMVGWSKLELLERAAALDPFSASHLGWIDFGIAHVARTTAPASVEPFANPPDNVRMHMLRYFDESDVRSHDYWDMRRGHLAGGFIVGSVPNILALAASFWTMAETALANNYGPTEDCILPVVIARQPGRFSFSYGDYEDVLLNHIRVRGGGGHLLFEMRDARERKAWNHGLAVGREAVAGHCDGTFGCHEGTLEPLIMEYFIAARYGSTNEEAQKVALYYAHQAETNPAFRSVYLANRDFVINNFSCLETPVLLPET
jgi:hypothetical protein